MGGNCLSIAAALGIELTRRKGHRMFVRSRLIALSAPIALALAGLLGVALPAAAQLQWDPGQTGPSTGPSGGNSTWTSSAVANWFSPGPPPLNVPWNNSGTATAVFGGQVGTVTIDPAGDNGPVQAAGLTFQTDGYLIIGGTLTLTGSGQIDTTSVNATISVPIGGPGGLTKVGPGTLALTTGNTYSGPTNINGGAVALMNASALATPTTVGNGGAVQLTGGLTVSQLLTLNGGGVANDGALRNTAGNNSWTGAITLGSATRINSDAGTLTISTGGINGGAANTPLTIGGAGNVTVSAVIGANVGLLTKDGSGTLTLGSTSNAFTGGITITGGVLAISSTNNMPSGAGPLTIDGGTFRHTSSGAGSTFINTSHPIVIGGTTTTGTIDIPSSTAILTYTPASNTTLITSAGGAGTGTIVKSGAGTLRLSSSTTTAALMNVQKLVVTGGLWQAGVDGCFGAVPGSTLADQITLNGGGISSNAGFTLNSNRGITLGNSGGTINTSSSLTYSGKITGAGSLTKTGASTLILGGASNDYTGGTTIAAGTLQLTTGNNRLPVTGNLTFTAASTLDLNTRSQQINALSSTGGVGTITTVAAGTPTLTVGNGDGTGSFSGIIQNGGGTVALTKTGTGTQTLTGANTYTGATTVSGGTLALTGSAVIGSSAITVGTAPGSTAVLDVSGLASTFQVGSGKTLGGHGTVAGPVAAAGTVAPGTSAGTLSFGNGLTLSGTYAWELATAGSPDGTSGGLSSPSLPHTNHDVINVTGGTLNLTGSLINLTSLGAAGSTGFDNTQPYSWQIAFAPTIVSLPQIGTISGADFAGLTATNFSTSVVPAGGGSVLLLNYSPVPEPAFVLLACGAAVGGAGWWRRSKRG